MKKLLFILLFLNIVLYINTLAQTIEKIKISQTGTSELVNNMSEIKLMPKTEQYYVILTPLEEYAELYIETKDPDKFVVKSKNTSQTKFDYIVIEKRIKSIEVDKTKKDEKTILKE
jgi:hypothetical protein